MTSDQVTKPLYWSIRRELWENRSITVAPLIAVTVVFLGFLFSMMALPQKMRALSALDPARQRGQVAMPFSAIAGMLVMTAFVVGVFYCLDAMHGERRERSILFWKSLPVSDRTTVLAKAAIPLAILPLVCFVIIVIAQLLMLMVSMTVLRANGVSASELWSRLPLFQMMLALLYAQVAMALWHAPIYAWLLLVSAWARRAAILWAVLPLLAAAAFERVAFGTTLIGALIQSRLIGWFRRAFIVGAEHTAPVSPLAELTPGKFLATPGLWVGLALAAAFLAAAVRLRRNREPI